MDAKTVPAPCPAERGARTFPETRREATALALHDQAVVALGCCRAGSDGLFETMLETMEQLIKHYRREQANDEAREALRLLALAPDEKSRIR